MRKPRSVASLEKLGAVRLSKSFYMRDFLYSEIASMYGQANIPDDPDLAIETASRLCQELLEPLNATFGRVSIFSGYRSPEVNRTGNERRHNCASNEANYAGHIFDYRDAEGGKGATASIVIPWFADRYEAGADWRSMAWWIHDHLPYSDLCFFPKLAAFNISWHEHPKREIYSYIEPKGWLVRAPDADADEDHGEWYKGFPTLRTSPA